MRFVRGAAAQRQDNRKQSVSDLLIDRSLKDRSANGVKENSYCSSDRFLNRPLVGTSRHVNKMRATAFPLKLLECPALLRSLGTRYL